MNTNIFRAQCSVAKTVKQFCAGTETKTSHEENQCSLLWRMHFSLEARRM